MTLPKGYSSGVIRKNPGVIRKNPELIVGVSIFAVFFTILLVLGYDRLILYFVERSFLAPLFLIGIFVTLAGIPASAITKFIFYVYNKNKRNRV